MNSPLEPETILQDRYLIVETIEQAERYRVYLAEDQQAGGENCILREFAASDVNQVVRIHDQFTPIIHQLQALRHPQLEKFKDFLIQEKNLYLIQSYFEGQDYQTRLSGDSPLTEDEAIQLLRQALPALSYLHSQFVIHGDISPSHLLLRSPDGALIFTHFGFLQEIAAQMGIETAETKLLNRVEQLSVIPSGAAQDLYALAVTVLMLLTSKEPQDLFNRQTQSWDWENYRLLSDRLTDVINRMLSVNPTAPPPTADAILTILESVKIPPPTPPKPPLNLPNTPQLIPTEATSFPVSNTSFIPEPSKDLPKSIITGSIILGIFVLAGLALVRYLPSFSTLQPQPTQTPEPTSNLPQVPQFTPVSPAFPPPIPPISPPSPTPFSPSPVQPSTSNNTVNPPPSSPEPTPSPVPTSSAISTPQITPIPQPPRTNLIWRSQSNLTQITNLNQICFGNSNLNSVQTVFGHNKPPFRGSIKIFSPKTGRCDVGDTFNGSFDLSGSSGHCVGDVTITWQNNNNAFIEWNITNLGSACPVDSQRWQINTYPVGG